MFNAVDRAAIRQLAAKYGVPLAWALGLAEVESAGRAFWTVDGKRVPAINLEGHYFYKYLPEDRRDEAVRLGLAHPQAFKTSVPTSFKGRYDMLARWIKIDASAALQSISMGIGQVMGAHYKRLGFKTPQDMWETAQGSLAGQVELMLRFITTDNALMQAIAAGKYAVVASIYNGPKYKVNSYDTKIEKAVTKYEANEQALASYNTEAELAAIKKLGFDTVEAFQQAHNLVPDGLIGPITRDIIEKATLAARAKPVAAAKTVAVGTVAGGTVIGVITEVSGALEQVQPVLGYLKTLGTFGPSVVLIGVGALVTGVTVFSFYKAIQGIRTA